MLGQLNTVIGNPITNPLAKDAMIKVLVGPSEGWQDHVMRVIELQKDGYTPKHTHAWPHINLVLEGTGILYLNGVENEVKAGAYAFIPGGELHQFKNAGDSPFKFVCIVPKEGHQ